MSLKLAIEGFCAEATTHNDHASGRGSVGNDSIHLTVSAEDRSTDPPNQDIRQNDFDKMSLMSVV